MPLRSYVQHLGATPQSQPIPGREAEMAPNAAGGYSFTLDDWTRLDRWLILGSEGGTYYAGERSVTVDNARAILRCIAVDGERVVRRTVEISHAGRAPKNDPAILALALAAKRGDALTRKAAYTAVPEVCRIGTHLFAFAEAVQSLSGWGRGARNAVGRWYTEREADALAYQLVKYRKRGGWSHRDLLRLAHPTPSPLLAWAAGKPTEVALPRIIEGFTKAQEATTPRAVAALIAEYGLPREAVPSTFLTEGVVWEALLADMPLTALLRNLGNLGKAGVLAPLSAAVRKVVADLGDAERLHRSRIHPMSVLLAMRTYASGHGVRGSGAWAPVQQVVDALDSAFYEAVPNVPASGRRHLLAIDVSASMDSEVSGYPMSAREAAAAMALITARVEADHYFLGFDTGPVMLNVSPRMRLDEMLRAIPASGGTDCAVPVTWARREGLAFDVVTLYTDNETWYGREHPTEGMDGYRRSTSPHARFVSVALTATGTSVADTADPLALNCVGLDTSTPEVIRAFAAGEF